MISIPIAPESIVDSDFALITHDHRDHCDEETLLPMSRASGSCLFIGPQSVILKLSSLGIDQDRLKLAKTHIDLTNDIKVHVVPSAHPDVTGDSQSGWAAVGYVIEFQGVKIYHAGDTSLCDEVIDCLKGLGGIDLALIPVNERNYMRDKQGILGNMTVREAFFFTEEIGAKTLIPTHWDMFAQNQVYQDEIELLYKKLEPKFELKFGEYKLKTLC